MDKAGPEENCPGCQDRSVDRYRFRQRLIQAGVPAGALRIAIAWTAAGDVTAAGPRASPLALCEGFFYATPIPISRC